MSGINSRGSSPDSMSVPTKEKEREGRRRRKNSICDSDEDEDDEIGLVSVSRSALLLTESEGNRYSDRDRDRDRDVSPSAQSHHSSGTGVALEWDPSADVGAQVQVPSNTPVHQSQQHLYPPSQHLARLDEIVPADLSALDQIVLALNYGYDLRPYVAESRSQRFDAGDADNNNSNVNSNSSSNGHGRISSLHQQRQTSAGSGSKSSSSEGSNNSNSSYKTASETDPDQVRNTQDPPAAISDTTSSSWQTSGLTRSELKYMSRKRDGNSSRSHSSSSLLWVEVNAVDDNGNEKTSNNSSATRPQDTTTASEINPDTASVSLSVAVSKKSIGIQAKLKADDTDEDDHDHDPRARDELERKQRSQSQIQQSQGDHHNQKPILIGQKSKAKSKGIQVSASDKNKLHRSHSFSLNSNYKQSDSDVNGNCLPRSFGSSYSISAEAAVTAASACNQNYTYQSHSRSGHYSNSNSNNLVSGSIRSHRHTHTVSVTGPGSGRSLNSHPSGSRSSHGRKGNGNPNDNSEGSSGGSDSKVKSLVSSDHLTPTCALLDKIISEGNANIRNYGYDFLEQHRNTLVYKMRKEFQHLERLNKILLEKRQGHQHQRSAGGSQRLVASSLKETSVSISNSSSNENGHPKDGDFSRKSSRAAVPKSGSGETSTVSGSSLTVLSSDGSKSKGYQTNIQIKQSRRPYDYGADMHSKGTQFQQVKTVTQKTQVIQVCDFKKPVSYFLPFASGPLGSSHQYTVPTIEIPTSSRGKPRSRQGSISNGEYRQNGDEKENQKPKGKRHDERRQEIPEDDESDLYGGIGGGYVVLQDQLVQISLQQAFKQNCPTVVSTVQQREYLLSQLKQEREFSSQVKRNYFQERENCLSPNDSLNKALPARETRIMSTKEMHTLTEKKIKNLPEVKEKVVRRRLEEDKKTNRILSQVFSKKLRQHVLKGDMNIVNSKRLIRH